ncbi:hypothetical protein Tco_0905661 [Tanacetum coccineum]
MSVHNSEHNSPINSNHDDDVHDPVTRISKLDISDPLHLHPNDTIALTVISIKLKGTKNYQVWSCAMLLALEGRIRLVLLMVLVKDLILMRFLYDAMIELPKCICNASEGFKKHNQLLKLIQFLMGLDDSYMQIRSSILSRETLRDVRSAYATISSEVSHKVVVGIIGGVSGLNNNWQGGGSGLVCENCSFNGHSIDRCFKIIGYLTDFGKKKSGQSFKKQNVSNNSVGKSSSSEMNKWPLSYLSSKTIKANQHMTYADKELDNVIDISHLRIKVGGSTNRTYTTSLTKTKAVKYDLPGIEDMQLYKFTEGNFPQLHLHDIEDMLILLVQNRLFNLKGPRMKKMTKRAKKFR